MADPPSPGTAAIEDLLPLTPAAFHILLVLAEGATHGYAIMQQVAELTDRLVHLGPGTLYRSIQRLLDDGLIEEVAESAPANADRRQYRLTVFGRRVACAEAARLAVLVRAARRRGLLDPPPVSRRRGASP
jgi:DNA-binding PadR family transcriptional regulator